MHGHLTTPLLKLFGPATHCWTSTPQPPGNVYKHPVVVNADPALKDTQASVAPSSP